MLLFTGIAEHVGVAAAHFFANTGGNVVEIELAFFLCDARVKNDIEQQVAEFLLQVFGIVALDRIEQFMGFVEGMRRNRFAGLANIPGAAALGVA